MYTTPSPESTESTPGFGSISTSTRFAVSGARRKATFCRKARPAFQAAGACDTIFFIWAWDRRNTGTSWPNADARAFSIAMARLEASDVSDSNRTFPLWL